MKHCNGCGRQLGRRNATGCCRTCWCKNPIKLRKQVATRLANIPPDLHDLYRHLTRSKRMSAAEAAAVIQKHSEDTKKTRRE